MGFWSNNTDVEYMELGKIQDIHFMIRYSPNHDTYSMDVITTQELTEYGFVFSYFAGCGYFDSDKIKEFQDSVGIT
ncbi:MAG: hypothetical protein GY870_04660 [archaeon]|nr:hypothetical protein [archaeon]